MGTKSPTKKSAVKIAKRMSCPRAKKKVFIGDGFKEAV
jgi:hypothetical protein